MQLPFTWSSLSNGFKWQPDDPRMIAMCRELRLGPPPTAPAVASERYQLRVELEWQPAAPARSDVERGRPWQDSVVTLEGGVDGIARNLDRVAGGHDLLVSVPVSRRFIILSRA